MTRPAKEVPAAPTPNIDAAVDKDPPVPYSRRAKYNKIIRKFVNSTENVLEFSPKLTKIERTWVHQIATQWKVLNHESFGEGKDRYIVVSKKPMTVSVPGELTS